MKEKRNKTINNIILLVLTLLILVGFSSAAVVSHAPAQVTPGTFAAGNYVFPDNLSVSENVGIGTSSPVRKLHIHSSTNNENLIRITNAETGSTDSDGIGIGLDIDESAFIWHRENNHLKFATNNTEKMRITNSGDVGIGTINPNYKLDVSGTGRFTGALSSDTLDTGQGANELYDMDQNVLTSSRPDFAGVDLTSNLQVTSSATTGQPVFSTFTSSNSETLMIRYAEQSTGVVPADTWQFRMGGTARDIVFTNYDNTAVLKLDTSGSISVGTTTTNEKIAVVGGGIAIDEDNNGNWVGIGEYNQGLALSDNADASATPRIFIENGGQVGIGTTTPSFNLDVSGGGRFTGNLRVDTTVDTTVFIDAGASHNTVIDLQEGGSRRWAIWNGGSLSDTLYITDIDASNGVQLSQNSNSWAAYSDIRFKSNITTLNNVLDSLENFRAARYFFKNNTEYEIGIIAQEINKSYPELVNADKNGYLSMTYDRIGPIAIQAIKELKAEKDSEINTLKEENQLLKQALCEEFPEKQICNT